MLNHSSDLIDELVKLHLKPALKELGFKSKSSTFFRQKGELVEVVSPQKSKWNGAEEAKFTINLGVYWPKVHEVLQRVPASVPPKEYHCTLRQRLGPLFDQQRDYWWTVTPSSNVRVIGQDVVEQVRKFALPWFVKATSLDEATQMAPTPAAVVMLTMKGEQTKATALITDAIAESKHAKAFLRSLAERLKLEIPLGI